MTNRSLMRFIPVAVLMSVVLFVPCGSQVARAAVGCQSVVTSYGEAADHDQNLLADTQYFAAQSFQLSETIELTRITVGVLNLEPSGDSIEVQIRSGGPTITDPPGETILASVVTLDLAPGYHFVDVDFPSGTFLSAATPYYIVATSNFGGFAGYVVRADGSSPGYADGQVFFSESGGANWTSLDWDLLFKVWTACTPTPTHTQTDTPTATPTATPSNTASATPTNTPPPKPTVNLGTLANAVGRPGGFACLTGALINNGTPVSATRNDATFDSTKLGISDCTIHPAIAAGTTADKQLTQVNLGAGQERIDILGNLNPLPDGLLYTCRADIVVGTPVGSYAVSNAPSATDTFGNPIPEVEGTSANILVRTCPGDCDGDNTVTLGEATQVVNHFLGLPLCPAASPNVGCPMADSSLDGMVSLGEVQQAITRLLGGCS